MNDITTSFLSDKDLKQLDSLSISPQEIERQLDIFKKGVPFVDLVEAATPGKGIDRLDEKDIDTYVRFYKQKREKLCVTKFVPASGAASRMFKDLFNFIDQPSLNSKAAKTLQDYKHFAFSDKIEKHLSDKGIGNDVAKLATLIAIADFILNETGLNYGNLPKGLIDFHTYDGVARTAFEEHLVEGALYAKSSGDTVRIHFTISPEHESGVKKLIQHVTPAYESKFNVQYDISYSVQSPCTDTLAVNIDNTPFRNSDGSMLFRPAGHGALIENLNKIDADVVFIKNIDNVVPDRLKDQTVTYKKALAGYLLTIQETVFGFIQKLESNNYTQEDLSSICTYAKEHFRISPPENTKDIATFMIEHLNKPIRVCGMVKNEGEPGGGPFWVNDSHGELTLQIVESSQIDLENEDQEHIVEHSTHFNPVDLVCAIKNYKGEAFDLHEYIDPSTSFISSKSKDGKELKALERPGLWNGAMAYWLSVFVEVPLITFNPVKTVADLLRKEHQN